LDVSLIIVVHDHAPAGFVVVGLVQAQVLRPVRLRTLDHDSLDRRCQQLSIWDVGTSHGYSERTALSFD
jgi:hypothetical protein